MLRKCPNMNCNCNNRSTSSSFSLPTTHCLGTDVCFCLIMCLLTSITIRMRFPTNPRPFEVVVGMIVCVGHVWNECAVRVSPCACLRTYERRCSDPPSVHLPCQHYLCFSVFAVIELVLGLLLNNHRSDFLDFFSRTH